jgi:hypothetical protein
MKTLMAAAVLALLAGACWLVAGSDPLQPPAALRADVAESADESPFDIGAHRRPPRPMEERAAQAASPPVSLATRIERLKATDDPRDAFQAFQLITRCVRARERDDEIKALPPGPDFAAERNAYGDGRQRVREACQDITHAQIAARLPLVDKAAHAGVHGAVTARIGEGPFGDRSALDQRPDDPLVTEWVEQAIAHVKDAARRDDVEAIVQLGLLSLYWELDEVERLKTLMQHVRVPGTATVFGIDGRTPRADEPATQTAS